MSKDLGAAETIQVDRVGKYGVQTNGVWYNVNEPITPQHFVDGESYSVIVRTSKTGKKYIQEIVDKVAGVGKPINGNGKVSEKPISKVKVDPKPVNKRFVGNAGRDFDKEARGKTRCQLFGQASTNYALLRSQGMSAEESLAEVLDVAKAGFDYTFQD